MAISETDGMGFWLVTRRWFLTGAAACGGITRANLRDYRLHQPVFLFKLGCQSEWRCLFGHATSGQQMKTADLLLGENEVSVWLLDIHRDMTDHWHILSSDEKQRADRFQRENDRLRFITAHGMLRIILARCLQENPGDLVFSAGPFGKPFLPAYPHLQFSLSHSSDKAALAVALRRSVGIDIECTTSSRKITADMEERILSENEIATVSNLAESAKQLECLRLWTHKEAYLKAIGSGLSLPPREIEFCAGSDSLLVLRRSGIVAKDSSIWSSRELTEISGYVGAVVAEGASWNLKRYDYLLTGTV